MLRVRRPTIHGSTRWRWVLTSHRAPRDSGRSSSRTSRRPPGLRTRRHSRRIGLEVVDVAEEKPHADRVEAVVPERQRLGPSLDQRMRVRSARLRQHRGARVDPDHGAGVADDPRAGLREEPRAGGHVEERHARPGCRPGGGRSRGTTAPTRGRGSRRRGCSLAPPRPAGRRPAAAGRRRSSRPPRPAPAGWRPSRSASHGDRRLAQAFPYLATVPGHRATRGRARDAAPLGCLRRARPAPIVEATARPSRSGRCHRRTSRAETAPEA